MHLVMSLWQRSWLYAGAGDSSMAAEHTVNLRIVRIFAVVDGACNHAHCDHGSCVAIRLSMMVRWVLAGPDRCNAGRPPR
jgi:hypothetical protein